MVAPVAVDPFRRLIVVEDSSGYRFGTFHWLPTPRVDIHNTYIPRSDHLAAARRAAATEQGRTFLHWARFPFFVVSPAADSAVYIVDARYTVDENAGFGAVLIGDWRVEIDDLRWGDLVANSPISNLQSIGTSPSPLVLF